jgi:hypothetical protein
MDNLQPVETISVDTKFELTEEMTTLLKEKLGNKLKKIVIEGQTYVFKPLTKLEWDTHILKWIQERARTTKNDVSQEERHQRLIDVSVVFPSIVTTFQNNTAFKLLFWNNVPAGVPSRLVQLIQHHSGYLVQGMISERDVTAEDLFEAEETDPRPSPETLEIIKSSTDMPCKLVRIRNKWWVIRGLRYAEAKTLKKFLIQDPDSNYELTTLKSCILMGDTHFDSMLAGEVHMLIVLMNQISGLSSEGAPEEELDVEADDL